MSKTVYMIDIETTSADKEIAEVLEIGILALHWTHRSEQLLVVTEGEPVFHMFLHTDKEPATNFAREHQVELFKRCQQEKTRQAVDVRDAILDFFRSHRTKDPAEMIGLNAASFDLPLMVKHGFLKESIWVDTTADKQELVGDFHYRVDDITGVRMAAKRILNLSHSALTAAAVELGQGITLPDGKAHDAIYDCYRQAKMYNGLMWLLRGGRSY